MKAGILWLALLVGAALLIIAGIQGSAGRFLAVILTPGRLQPTESGAWD